MTCAIASERLGLALIGLACLCLNACASGPVSDSPSRRPFSWDTVMKTDVDMVAETHLQASLRELRTLMQKLYRRNPREWRKAGQPSLDAAVARAFDGQGAYLTPPLPAPDGIDSVRLAFADDYHGDRVFAFAAGLAAMILEAYEGRQRFHVWDDLDPQPLYNAARNLEIAAWKLGHDHDARGRPFLLANQTEGVVPNLSFERLFGKLIALQDNMAQIVANQSNRNIKTVIQTLASAVFLPI